MSASGKVNLAEVGARWSRDIVKVRPAWALVIDKIMAGAHERFAEYDHHPTREQMAALWHAARIIMEMARGRCAPWAHVCGVPPGVGKTTILSEGIKALLADPAYAHVGCLIMVNTLDQIPKLIAQMGLRDDQFSVVTGKVNTELNSLGRPRVRNGKGKLASDHQNARVLFTTQQMIKRLSLLPSIHSIFTFISQRPGDSEPGAHMRQVRIWDESLLPAEPMVLSAVDVESVAQVLEELEEPAHAAVLREWCAEAFDSTIPTKCIRFPMISLHLPWKKLHKAFSPKRPMVRELLGRSGGFIRIFHDGSTGEVRALLRERSLPHHFFDGGVLVLDASAPWRATYKHWGERVNRLPDAPKNYTNLTVTVVPCAVGRMAYGQPERRLAMARKVAWICNQLPPVDPVLVILRKDHGEELKEAISLCVKEAGGDPGRLSFLTWGRHTATNEFAHIKHVIDVGLLQYPSAANEALVRACGNIRPGTEVSFDELEDMRRGEIQHHLFQGACRGAIRRAVKGDVPAGCTLWVLCWAWGEKGVDPEMVAAPFPGCELVVLPAEGRRGRHSTRGEALQAMIVELLARREGQAFWIDELEQVASRAQMHRLLHNEDVRAALSKLGLELLGVPEKKGSTRATRYTVKRVLQGRTGTRLQPS